MLKLNPKKKLSLINVDDIKYKDYIEGQIASNLQIEYVTSLDLGSPNESIIVNIRKRIKFSFLEIILIYSQIIRLKFLGLILFPILAALSLIYLDYGFFNLVDSLILCLSLFFVQASFFALNDYYDHKNGVDRIDCKSGSQMIQKGLVPAYKVKRIGQIFVVISGLLGLFIIKFNMPLVTLSLTSFLYISSFLAIFGYAVNGLGLKSIGLGEIVIFFVLGPLLSLGVSLVTLGMFYKKLFLMGLIFGFMASIVLQMKKLESVLVDSRAGIRTLVSRLGFDLAKKIIGLELLFFPFLFFILGKYVISNTYLLLGLALVLFTFCFWIYRGLEKAVSPLSSFVYSLEKKALILHSLTFVVLVFGLYQSH